MSAARRIAEFVLGAEDSDVPSADRAAIAQSCFDLIGTTLAGRTSRHGQMIEHLVRTDGGAPECTVLGASLRAPALQAALCNATASHADDFDDMGGYGHPSAPMLPALLAAAELRSGVSGKELITAYAVGFETGAVLCQLGHYDQYARCFHSTPVFGTVAAACAAARLLGLDVDQTVAAIAMAASFAAGLGRNSGTMVKPLHAGQAASNALLAVLLAREGVRGADGALEARGGFWETFFATPTDSLDAIVDSLGMPYRSARSLFIKQFPCCGSNQSALHGLQKLIDREGLKAADVAQIVVHRMNETSPVLRYPEPQHGLNGKFSIQFTVASLLLRGRLGIAEFEDSCVQDPRIRETLPKVRPEILSRWNPGNAGKSAGNSISVTTHDGRQYHAFVPRTRMPGSPENPLSDTDLRDKFLTNCARSIADITVSSELAAMWRQLDGLPDVRVAIARAAG